MTKSREKLDHGLHNELVCDYLELKQEFADWIITTAFYASLQFVSFKVFPYKYKHDGKEINIENIDDLVKTTSGKIGKHRLLSDLVYRHCNKIGPDYERLMDMSMNARYTRYQIDKELAVLARSLMKKIKTHCIN